MSQRISIEEVDQFQQILAKLPSIQPIHDLLVSGAYITRSRNSVEWHQLTDDTTQKFYMDLFEAMLGKKIVVDNRHFAYLQREDAETPSVEKERSQSTQFGVATATIFEIQRQNGKNLSRFQEWVIGNDILEAAAEKYTEVLLKAIAALPARREDQEDEWSPTTVIVLRLQRLLRLHGYKRNLVRPYGEIAIPGGSGVDIVATLDNQWKFTEATYRYLDLFLRIYKRTQEEGDEDGWDSRQEGSPAGANGNANMSPEANGHDRDTSGLDSGSDPE